MTSSDIRAEQCPQCGAPLRSRGQRVSCAYCGASLIRRVGSESEPAGEWGLRMRAISCVDQQGTGSEAFRLLIPADWEFEGGVQWLMNNPGMPAVITCRAYNPSGPEAFEVFPNIPCYWTNSPMAMVPPGSLYYGNEVRPPGPALQVLEQLVVPRYRGGQPQLRIVEREPLPELAQQMQSVAPGAPTGITSAEGARMRLRYSDGGRDVEEDLFGVVEVARTGMPMMMGMMEHIFWMADYLFSFRAQAGQLDGLRDQFNAILRSFRLNPQWYARYLQVSQFMIQNQIQQIRQVGQLSRIISRTSDQISDMVMDSYYQRQETMGRIADQFSQAIRSVDEYHDPFDGRRVELPGGYDHAWSNPLGEYIVTNDANFDPNTVSTMDWSRMERRQ